MQKSLTKELQPIRWEAGSKIVSLIDQRLLPYKFEYVEIRNQHEMAAAIKDMVLRGAPLIGIAAAFGVVLAYQNYQGNDLKQFFQETDELLRNTRPTAVNLMWALDQMAEVYVQAGDDLAQRLEDKAIWILEDDIARCKAMSQVGADYIKNKFSDKISRGDKLKIMTHCNAGALATGGYGTALGVIRKLAEEDLVEMVYSDETRPRQQGSRLTVWEMVYENIPVTMNTDNMSAHLMKQGLIDLVVVGSDRIAANGDAANKIGTYQLAIAAEYHSVPFFVAAPMSTVDQSLESGDLIPIEERSFDEVSHINDKACTFVAGECDGDFDEVKFANPGFDVTPRKLIEAIFTEKGLY